MRRDWKHLLHVYCVACWYLLWRITLGIVAIAIVLDFLFPEMMFLVRTWEAKHVGCALVLIGAAILTYRYHRHIATANSGGTE